LIAIKYAERGKAALPFILSLAVLMLLIPFLEDETRVLAIITFPLLTIFWLANPDFLKTLSKNLVSLLFLVWLIVPWLWIWEGHARGSVFQHDMVFLLQKLSGAFPLPDNAPSWPFN
jgi:hypothetical protein